jgi:hypothetical protein
MARVQNPTQGRLIVSVIYNSIDGLADCLKQLEKQFGRVQSETLEIECSANRYHEEMGQQLSRRFFSFEKLVDRETLPEIKATCHKIERGLGDQVDDFTFRTVNVDPGVLTPTNLTMASHREYSHRVYLGKGVFAEVTLIHARGRFTQLPWTNPDFCDEEAVRLFIEARATFPFLTDSKEKFPDRASAMRE